MPLNTHYFDITKKHNGIVETERVTRISPLTLHGVGGFAIHRHYEKHRWWLKVSHEETGACAAKIVIAGEKDKLDDTAMTSLITLARERTKSKANILRAVQEYKDSLPLRP
jgi:hypothetical protein